MSAAPTIQSTSKPSIQKYGEILLRGGFDQVPHSVQAYLNTLGLCQSAKLLIFALLSYLREFSQEVFPSVKTLADRIERKERRVRQLTAQLVEIGLVEKIERFGEHGQLSNGYSLVPIFRKVAAWKDSQVAEQLAQEEAERDMPFVPADQIDEAAIALEEEYGQGEPKPRTERHHAQRLRTRWEKMSGDGHEWDCFADMVIEASNRTDERRKKPTTTRQAFTKLIPYFFSSLDHLISKAGPSPARPKPKMAASTAGALPESARRETQSEEGTTGVQTMAQRRRQRVQAEANGQRRVRASAKIEQRIKDLAQEFHDSAIKSSIQRAANLMADVQIDETRMLDLIQQAREVAQKHQVQKRNQGQINRMPYFFSVLEQKIMQNMEN